MSLYAKTFLNLMAGAIAGLLAWALTDLTGWFGNVLKTQHLVGVGYAGYGQYLLYGALFGLILGLLLGVIEALSLDSERQMWVTLGLSGAIGFAGGALGLHIGQVFYGMLVGASGADTAVSPGRFLTILFARAIGWSLIGAIVGLAQGAGRRSAVMARQGAFGGWIGGLLGGTVFQIIATIFYTIPRIDVMSRLAALVATGALIGFFIGLVQNLFKQAWIKVMVGRNEGKEYLIAKPVMTIGRSELSDIGLFGDVQIAPTHAVIEALPAQKRHRLRHVAGDLRGVSYPPTVVNGQPVTAEQWLTDGDTIQIGQRAMQFHEKATRGVPREIPATSLPAGQFAPRAGLPPSSPSVPPAGIGTATQISPAPPPEVIDRMGVAPEPAAPSHRTVSSNGYQGPIGTRLVCIQGPYNGQSFHLSHRPLTIGRTTDRDLAFPADPAISRAHARILYEGGKHLVSDDGSVNGTYINGRRIADTQPLSSGDILLVGETSLRYE